ncbi:hypothetical protein CYY_007355 [Polysphondylium violaceum]|uniref:SHSP domain-containing protein n=1 Tax=Polysphondylium violaceum TaxID=133409 RepID=A0A8J4V4Z0_9MYCE|nr:hypothetical protein CYY_007355 [Polysphondylium violaceum]
MILQASKKFITNPKNFYSLRFFSCRHTNNGRVELQNEQHLDHHDHHQHHLHGRRPRGFYENNIDQFERDYYNEWKGFFKPWSSWWCGSSNSANNSSSGNNSSGNRWMEHWEKMAKKMENEFMTKYKLHNSVHYEENDSHIQINIELPGLTKNDIKLSVNNGTLTISAEKQSEQQQEEKKSYSFKSHSFQKTLKLTDDIDISGISAKMENGLLEITLPKQTKSTESAHNIKIE